LASFTALPKKEEHQMYPKSRRIVRQVVGLGLLVALTALALNACGAGGQENNSSDSSEPRATNLEGKILFARKGGKYKDETIFTAAANGTHERRISGFGMTCCPRFSPDGTKVSWGATSPDGERFTTAIVRADGSHPQKIPIRDPTLNLGPGLWSPDGKQIAFEGWDDSNRQRNGVYIADVPDGKNLHRLTRNPLGSTDVPMDFSPDGSRMVFLRSEPVEDAFYGSLFVANVDGTGLHRITPPGSHIQSARWSPDGEWIVFGSTGSTPWNVIEMVRPDGTGQKTVFEDPDGGSAFTPIWSPDSQKIMFALIGNSEYSKPEDEMNNKVYVINEDGKGLAEVLDTPDFKKLADWVDMEG
jgi:Tol biopolymer transport system component